MSSHKKIVRELLNVGDTSKLRKLLHNTDPQVRSDAAVALGELHDLDAVDSLARVFYRDPDHEVRRAAQTALSELLGSKVAETVIASYRNLPEEDLEDSVEEDEDIPDEDRLFEPSGDEDEQESENDLQPEQSSKVWSASDLYGLITVLRDEKNPRIRIKAVHALEQIDDIGAVNALAATATYDLDEEVQNAAHQALENTYGEDVDKYIAQLIHEDDETEVEEGDGVPLEGNQEIPPEPGWSSDQQVDHPSVIEEINPGRNILIGLAVLLLLGLVILIIYFRGG